jgi:uncharacterized protein (TIGR00725 family)
MRVSVIGGTAIDERQDELVEAVGREVAERGHVLVCGGLGGTTTAACRGAREVGGETIGILPGEDRTAANEYVTTPIATGLGHARNALVAMNGDGVVALEGNSGTVSELGFAGVYDRPIAGIDTYDVPGVEHVSTPEGALDYLESAVGDP